MDGWMARMRSLSLQTTREADRSFVQLAFKFLLLSPLLKSCLTAAAPRRVANQSENGFLPSFLHSLCRPTRRCCRPRPRKSFVRFRRRRLRRFWRQRQQSRQQTCSFVCMDVDVVRGSWLNRTPHHTHMCSRVYPSSSLKSSPDPFSEQTEQCNGRYSILESQCSSPSSHARICRSGASIHDAHKFF